MNYESLQFEKHFIYSFEDVDTYHTRKTFEEGLEEIVLIMFDLLPICVD